MKEEIKKFIYSKKSLVVWALIVLIMIVESVSLYLITLGEKSNYYYLDVAFLSGKSEGHIPQMIIFWFLPIILLLLFGDKILSEIENGTSNIYIVKKSKKKYINDKVKVGFLIGFGVVFLSLIINVIISFLLFKNNNIDIEFIESIKGIKGLEYSLWQFENPLISYLIYIIIASWFSGILSALVILLGTLIKDKKIVMASSFFIWFLLVSRGSKSVMNIFQPFNEFSLNDQISIFIESNIYVFVIILIIKIILKKRNDYV
ncbi:MAG: hypothetical protein ACRC1T_00770 [Clostridium chrysemydis]|uniref:hypothetical protein n=1 Tax=Clostridium chrysemydis TaxID=2665504 RepID=UPI003F3A0F23